MQVAVSEFIKAPNRYLRILGQASVTLTEDGQPIAVLAKPDLCPQTLKRMIPPENAIIPKKTIHEMLGDEYIHEEELDWGEPVGDEVW